MSAEIHYLNEDVQDQADMIATAEALGTDVRSGKVRAFVVAGLCDDGSARFYKHGKLTCAADCGVLIGLMSLFTHELNQCAQRFLAARRRPGNDDG